MPIFGYRDKDGNISVNFAHYDGIPNFMQKLSVSVTMDQANKRLKIKSRISKDEVYIAFEQICGMSVVTEKEIFEKSKSVLGRAVVGGVLLGPLGMIVGGMSGIGQKQKSISSSYLVLNYHPTSAPEEIKVISLAFVGATLHVDKLVEEINACCPLTQIQGFELQEEDSTANGYL